MEFVAGYAKNEVETALSLTLPQGRLLDTLVGRSRVIRIQMKTAKSRRILTLRLQVSIYD